MTAGIHTINFQYDEVYFSFLIPPTTDIYDVAALAALLHTKPKLNPSKGCWRFFWVVDVCGKEITDLEEDCLQIFLDTYLEDIQEIIPKHLAEYIEGSFLAYE